MVRKARISTADDIRNRGKFSTSQTGFRFRRQLFPLVNSPMHGYSASSQARRCGGDMQAIRPNATVFRCVLPLSTSPASYCK
jgi:hypothetical protein